MKISLIACINKVNSLGKNNELLYHIKEDLANFKRMTIGNILIMGKNTYESLPKKPLPNRVTIIISDDKDYAPLIEEDSIVYVCDSIESALSTAETIRVDEEVFVVGGASIYRQFIEQNLIGTMYLTVVNDKTEGDVFFPEIDEEKWKTVFKLNAAIKEGELPYEFVIIKQKLRC